MVLFRRRSRRENFIGVISAAKPAKKFFLGVISAAKPPKNFYWAGEFDEDGGFMDGAETVARCEGGQGQIGRRPFLAPRNQTKESTKLPKDRPPSAAPLYCPTTSPRIHGGAALQY